MRPSVFLGAALAVVIAPAALRAGTAPPMLYTEAARGRPAASGLPELAPMAKAILPAVVGILTRPAAREPSASEDAEALRELFQYRGHEAPRQGLASGFVIHPDGWILTNAHVVEGAGVIEVDLGDEGGRVLGKVVGADALTDIALLKVDAGRELPVAPLGDSDRLEIAEWILVVGNPFGLSHSVTLGIVSQIGRSEIAPQGKDGYYDFIQTDASINPGNSGGPLVNLRGEVVGIATAINATGQGIGFAIPINMAKDVLGQLQQHGRVVRSWMGVSVRELPRERGQRPAGRGVIVTGVVSGGPAATAGLTPGDVIIGFDGRDVPTPARLRWLVASAGVGRRVALSVRRGEAQRAFQVHLVEMPPAERDAVSRAAAADQRRE
jgi:serine protease Do